MLKMLLFCVLWLELCALCLSIRHSGLYSPNRTVAAKDYAAAFIISKERLFAYKGRLKNSRDLETTTLRLLDMKGANYRSVMTRDFLDFFVEHLSSSGNSLAELGEQQLLIDVLGKKAQDTATWLHSTIGPIEGDDRLDATVALIVFSSKAYSTTQNSQSPFRPPFLAATFWSLYRYFKSIIICVATDEDEKVVNDLNLPHLFVWVLDAETRKSYTVTLPRNSLLRAIEEMASPTGALKRFRYLYFTEGDQVLHVRSPVVLYDAIDRSGGTFIAVPQRMHTLALAQDFPRKFSSEWEPVSSFFIANVTIVVENAPSVQGSCCSAGDVVVQPCGNWWYQCRGYGLGMVKTWLKFGDSGFTTPPITAHKSYCVYSLERRLCPLSDGCTSRQPFERDGVLETCGEVVNNVLLSPGSSDLAVTTGVLPKHDHHYHYVMKRAARALAGSRAARDFSRGRLSG